jgi:hypothetical protein
MSTHVGTDRFAPLKDCLSGLNDVLPIKILVGAIEKDEKVIGVGIKSNVVGMEIVVEVSIAENDVVEGSQIFIESYGINLLFWVAEVKKSLEEAAGEVETGGRGRDQHQSKEDKLSPHVYRDINSNIDNIHGE